MSATSVVGLHPDSSVSKAKQLRAWIAETLRRRNARIMAPGACLACKARPAIAPTRTAKSARTGSIVGSSRRCSEDVALDDGGQEHASDQGADRDQGQVAPGVPSAEQAAAGGLGGGGLRLGLNGGRLRGGNGGRQQERGTRQVSKILELHGWLLCQLTVSAPTVGQFSAKIISRVAKLQSDGRPQARV